MGTSRTRAALALGAAVVLVTGLAAAYASSQSTATGTITACVRVKTGAMRLEKASQPCRTKAPKKFRERRVTWNKQGPPGADGSPGLPGLNGTNGVDGLDGLNGASFLSGAGVPSAGLGQDGDSYLNLTNGDVYTKAGGAWTQASSLLGPAGVDGTNGTNGTDGLDGLNGASFLSGAGAPSAGLGQNGDSYLNLTNGDVYSKAGGAWSKTGSLLGPAGGGTVFSASNGNSPAVLTTVLGGTLNTSTVLPLSGSAVATGVTLSGGPLDTTASVGGLAQVLPRATTVTSFAASFSTTVGVALVGSTVQLKAQLYTGDATGNTLTAVSGATCTLSPALTGLVTTGTTSTCQATGLSISVPAGKKAVVVITPTVAAGIDVATTLQGNASVSVGTSG